MRTHRSPRNPRYIWQLSDWPNLTYDAAALAALLAQVHRAQGQLMGRMAELGMAQRAQATLQVLTQEVTKTSEIEGERLNLDAVRSSIARRLGLDIGALAPSMSTAWRTDASGPMEVVSGAVGRETVHFTAPPASAFTALAPRYSASAKTITTSWRTRKKARSMSRPGSIGF